MIVEEIWILTVVVEISIFGKGEETWIAVAEILMVGGILTVVVIVKMRMFATLIVNVAKS